MDKILNFLVNDIGIDRVEATKKLLLYEKKSDKTILKQNPLILDDFVNMKNTEYSRYFYYLLCYNHSGFSSIIYLTDNIVLDMLIEEYYQEINMYIKKNIKDVLFYYLCYMKRNNVLEYLTDIVLDSKSRNIKVTKEHTYSNLDLCKYILVINIF